MRGHVAIINSIGEYLYNEVIRLKDTYSVDENFRQQVLNLQENDEYAYLVVHIGDVEAGSLTIDFIKYINMQYELSSSQIEYLYVRMIKNIKNITKESKAPAIRFLFKPTTSNFAGGFLS